MVDELPGSGGQNAGQSRIRTVTVPTEELRQAMQPLPEGIAVLVWDPAAPPEREAAEAIDAVVLPYMSAGDWAPQLQALPSLKLVHTQSTGYDGIPEMVGASVAVASATGVHAAATAEMAVGLALVSLRGLDVAVRDQQAGQWNPARYPGLADRRVLLVGVGGIGREIARRLKPFDVELTRVGSSARVDEHGQVHGSGELAVLAPDHDVLIAITPLTEATRGIISREVLAALPDGALVINVARGPVVDNQALTEEVVSGRLRAAIDVFEPEPMPRDHPLWSAPGAIISPHNGGNTGAFWPRIVKLLRTQLAHFAAGEAPENLVQPGPYAVAEQSRPSGA
jgi:phosphoglycerate dehydrogenase-like enzyme